MVLTELVTAIAQILVAVGAVTALGGTGWYMISRRGNGGAITPGAAHDATLEELRNITKAVGSVETQVKYSGDATQASIRKSTESHTKQHEAMMNTLAPRRVTGGSDEGSSVAT